MPGLLPTRPSARKNVRARRPAPPQARPAHGVDEVVRWAAFGCLLVPLALLACGSPPGGAAAAAAGLSLLTAVCRAVLRHCERVAARSAGRSGPHRGRHGRTGTGAHRGGHRQR
ncbi:hypothetical protein GCM10010420_23520 [Streptomyces glaucosporus]|uniref:Lipoprotein n=1 Tax=Streptomyces glaucosporus TaxID=284044 RepID=A0ABN3I9F8_9ACTN